MELPANIVAYLQSNYLARRRPFCISLDAEYRLLQAWGEPNCSALGGLVNGADVLKDVPFLLGQLGTRNDVLPFVRLDDGSIFEVHIIPENGQYFVIFLDASSEHDLLQQRQQTANEIRLLHESQRKLIGRQRALIGDLVEAKTELDHRRREAERNNASKSRFIAMMSHEFRTPLASIINYADLALEENVSERNVRKSNEAIARASRHLTMLVDTVLDDARLEAGHVQLNERPFDLRSLIDDMATIMAPLAAEKGLSFAAHLSEGVPPFLHADDICLRQILINLLGNAVKYTDHGSVTLVVDWESDRLIATVSDTGPGIEVADQERMFHAFERGVDMSQGTPGAGLGLAISLDLARLMRGRIALDSDIGAGCRVTVSLPAPAVEVPQPQDTILPHPAAELHAARPSSILLCDDDEDMLALAEYYLHRAGYGLLLARDGLEAVDKALAYNPDLVLMDINTPRLSGADATARLRQAGFVNPIVALTASDIRKIDGEDFTACLRKPIQMPELLAQIKRHLRGRVPAPMGPASQ
jgi:signal transduction histidine kinase